MDTVGSRIKAARRKKKMTQEELAKRLGIATSTVSRWESDKMDITLDNAAALAEALETTVDALNSGWLSPLGGGGEERVLPVVGRLEAGVWREDEEWDRDEYDYRKFTIKPEWRHLQLKVYVVLGNSMNKRLPSGSYVLVAPTIANGLTPRSGQTVVVNRRRRDGLYEATLKKYVVEDGREWLWPDSTSPEFQAPIQIANGNTEEVTITGIVASYQVDESLF